MRALPSAFLVLALVLGSPNQGSASENFEDDPRLQELFEKEDVGELSQSFFIEFLRDMSEQEREMTIRMSLWGALVGDLENTNDMVTVMGGMLAVVDGCLLPQEFCTRVRQENVFYDPVTLVPRGMNLLSGALMRYKSFDDCQAGRSGFVDGRIFDFGEPQFVLMSTTPSEDAPCFVRKLGS